MALVDFISAVWASTQALSYTGNGEAAVARVETGRGRGWLWERTMFSAHLKFSKSCNCCKRQDDLISVGSITKVIAGITLKVANGSKTNKKYQ